MTLLTTPAAGVNFTDEASSSGLSDGKAPFPFARGTTMKGVDNTEWVAVQHTSAISQYAAVGIDENFAAAPLTKAMADDGWFLGFAQTARTKGKRGWVALRGSNIKVLCRKAAAADTTLYTTATAGVLDDLASGQTNLDGIVAVTAASASATSTGQALELIATWPRSTTF